MNRRFFLKTSVAAGATLLVPSGWCAAQLTTQNSPAADGDLLGQATARIEQHRKGPGQILVRGENGRPLAGVKVSLEQSRHDFLFGCNFFRFNRLPNAELEDQYRRRFADLLNYATLGFYWAYYEPQRGKPIYAYTDDVVAWCKTQSITCKGHPLVWDYADPRWLPRDFAEIRSLSNARVREIIARYTGRIDLWDVVNEPTHLGRFNTRTGEWAKSMGPVPYVTENLKIARAANPKATLLVNDYRTDRPYFQILDALRENGKLLFDAIGIQSHMHDAGWPLERIWSVCDTYSKFGVPLHFTETTIVSGPRVDRQKWGPTTPEGEAKQAEYVPKFYTMLFAHPAVAGLTWWDFSDNGAWQGAPAGWLRKDMTPKPVYQRLMDLIKGQWWTKTEGVTNADGIFKTRAFYGQHRVKTHLPDGRSLSRDVHWERGGENQFQLQS